MLTGNDVEGTFWPRWIFQNSINLFRREVRPWYVHQFLLWGLRIVVFWQLHVRDKGDVIELGKVVVFDGVFI